MALIALVATGLHAPAPAAPAPAQPAAQAVAPCHAAAEAAPETSRKAPDAPACCPDGCDGRCTPVAACFGTAPRALLGFLRAVVEAPALARPPARLADTRERPPKPQA